MVNMNSFIATIVAYSTIFRIVYGNYPLDYNWKPCARLKNTVNYQKPICMDNGQGGFEAESENNCKTSFKATCPEFNEADCVRYNISFPNSSVPSSPVPCCRLRYYGRRPFNIKKYTWMEIYYTLQYGKNVSVYDIVEIKRSIGNHKAFGQRDQQDWPESVLNPNGERGLNWTIVTNLTQPPLKSSGNPADFCATENDTRCTVEVAGYMNRSFPNGFEDSRSPIGNNTVADEFNYKRNIFMTSSCRDVWVESQRARACQVLYHYNASWTQYKDGKSGINARNTQFVFLEAQVYYRPSKSSSSDLVLRYGYWFQEDPTTTSLIFDVNDRKSK